MREKLKRFYWTNHHILVEAAFGFKNFLLPSDLQVVTMFGVVITQQQ